MNEEPTYPCWVCTHCFIHLVNGDCTEVDDCNPVPMNKFEGLHVTPGMLREHHSCERDAEECECDCEQISFTWAQCDGCGSNLGGEREAVTGWMPCAS